MVRNIKSKWLKNTALTVACIIIVVLIKNGSIPTTDSPLWVAIPFIAGLIFGFLSLSAIGNAVATAIQPSELFKQWFLKRKKAKEVNDFIPYRTDKDREIIGYLLYHNQKAFQGDSDGGYAAPLIAKGIIRVACKQGQVFHPSWTPFEMPDFAWSVLEKYKSSFPYKPPPKGEVEKHPWAISWMVR